MAFQIGRRLTQWNTGACTIDHPEVVFWSHDFFKFEEINCQHLGNSRDTGTMDDYQEIVCFLSKVTNTSDLQ